MCSPTLVIAVLAVLLVGASVFSLGMQRSALNRILWGLCWFPFVVGGHCAISQLAISDESRLGLSVDWLLLNSLGVVAYGAKQHALFRRALGGVMLLLSVVSLTMERDLFLEQLFNTGFARSVSEIWSWSFVFLLVGLLLVVLYTYRERILRSGASRLNASALGTMLIVLLVLQITSERDRLLEWLAVDSPKALFILSTAWGAIVAGLLGWWIVRRVASALGARVNQLYIALVVGTVVVAYLSLSHTADVYGVPFYLALGLLAIWHRLTPVALQGAVVGSLSIALVQVLLTPIATPGPRALISLGLLCLSYGRYFAPIARAGSFAAVKGPAPTGAPQGTLERDEYGEMRYPSEPHTS